MNAETKLYRQIHPVYVETDGKIKHNAFIPTTRDNKQLSVYDGDKCTPQQAFEHYTGILNCKSAGVVCVTGTECIAEGLIPRPDTEGHHQYHAVIDFSSKKTKREINNAAMKLCEAAAARGWLYRP